jgi:RNA polymerase sigma factor (sigma-70 family)
METTTMPGFSNTDERSLLRSFAEQQDEAAFEELVGRYAGLVNGIALRRTGRPEYSVEIAQNVFLALARKAKSLTGVLSLAAWLHRATTLEALRYLRKENTRQRYLAMFHELQETDPPDDASDWEEIRPHLDELLNHLPQRDREIVMMHYFDELPFTTIAARTGLGEAAAQKRSVRALAKLARLFRKRGVTVSVSLLGLQLSGELGQAAAGNFVSEVSRSVLSQFTSTAIATSTTTTALTAMISSKFAFAAGFLIAASIPIAREISRPAFPPSVPVTALEEKPVAPIMSAEKKEPFDPDAFRDSLRQLQADADPDTAKIRQLQQLMFTLDDNGVLTAIAILDEFDRSSDLSDPLCAIVSSAYARWAEVDPASAVASAAAVPIARWNYFPILDPDSARKWAESISDEKRRRQLLDGLAK